MFILNYIRDYMQDKSRYPLSFIWTLKSLTLKCLNYQRPTVKQKKEKIFVPKIYFIRQVAKDKEKTKKAFIKEAKFLLFFQ